MANLINGANWSGNNIQNAKSQTYTFSTKNKYLDKDIALQINVKEGSVGDVSGGSLNGSNLVLSDVNNGIAVTREDISWSVTEGWVSSKDNTLSTETKYISECTIVDGKSFNVNLNAGGILNLIDSVNGINWKFTLDSNGNLTVI